MSAELRKRNQVLEDVPQTTLAGASLSSRTLLHKILVPVNFTARCQDATRYAAALACRFHAEVALLHVFVEPWAAYSSPEGYATPPPYDYESTIGLVKECLGQFLASELQALDVHRFVAEGDPATEIATYATTHDCDLIVMPTHGYGRFRRFLLGSTTAKVLHDVSCPVFTGPHLEHPPALDSPHFPRILCALDLSAESRGVLAWAGQFAAAFGSELTIVHALPPSTTRLEGIYFDSQWRLDMAAAARREIAGLQEQLQVPANLQIEVGEVPSAVRAVAESIGADLVVIGRGRSHGLFGQLRANTYGIVRESGCPVISV